VATAIPSGTFGSVAYLPASRSRAFVPEGCSAFSPALEVGRDVGAVVVDDVPSAASFGAASD
jgi:hypothetical protein